MRSRSLVGLAVGWFGAALLAQQPEAEATARLSGRVVRADGTPIAGAVVAFAPAQARTTAQWLAEPPLRTGADGTFTLSAPARVPSDDLSPPVLMVVAKGHAAVQPPPGWKFAARAKPGDPWLRQDSDVGAIVLPEGTRLFGRVRTADGKGLAGVEVVATDLLDHHNALPGAPTHARCRALSDDRGIFELPTALPNGVVLTFARDGHYGRSLRGVGAGAPIEVEMVPSGHIAGRVLDAIGAPVAGATVSATYERATDVRRVASGADGTFTLPLEHEGRFRVHATRRVGEGRNLENAESAVLEGASATVELAFAAAKAGTETLRVQAVTEASGQPIAGVRAAGIWEAHALQNANYLEYLVDQRLRQASSVAAGETSVAGPRENESRTGAVAVVAAGYAPHVERDVEWRDVAADAVREPLVVKLVPESTIVGRVVDERTGTPIVGARVWAKRKQDPTQGSFSAGDSTPSDAVISAEDGAFTLAQLGQGDWTLRVTHAERPAPPGVDLALGKAERRADVQLKMAAGARLGGRITGLALPSGAHALVCPVAAPRLGEAGRYWYSHSNGNERQVRVPIGPDGAFQFTGLATKSYYLVVEVPSPPRCGESVYLPIEPLRVPAAGVQRDFDASGERLGRLTGRITYPHAVPDGVLPVVVAQMIADEGQGIVHYGRTYCPGPRAFPKTDGSFALALAPGKYRVVVVDAVVGVQLAEAGEPVVIGTEVDRTCEIAVPLHEVVVRCQPPTPDGPMPWLTNVEVRHEPAVKQGGNVVFGGANDHYDTGSGVPVPIGATSLRLWLPPGKVTLLARAGGVERLRHNRNSNGTAPLVREEFDLAADATAPRDVTLTIAAMPPIDEAAAADPNGSRGDGK